MTVVVVILLLGGLVTAGDPKPKDVLDQLVDELAKSNRSTREKVDAIYLATVGRYPTQSDLKRIQARYGEKPDADQLRLLLAELTKTSDFDSHLDAMQSRTASGAQAQQKFGTLPYFPLAPQSFSMDGFGSYMPSPWPRVGGAGCCFGYTLVPGWDAFLPNPFLSPRPAVPRPLDPTRIPWTPPGAKEPLPRLDSGIRGGPPKPLAKCPPPPYQQKP